MVRFKITFQTEETAEFFALNFTHDEDYKGTTTFVDFTNNEVIACFKNNFAEEAEMMIWGYANCCGFDSQIVSVEKI